MVAALTALPLTILLNFEPALRFPPIKNYILSLCQNSSTRALNFGVPYNYQYMRSISLPKEGSVVTYNKVVFKGAVVTLIVVFVGLLVVDNIMFDADEGLITRGDLQLSWALPSDLLYEEQVPNIAGYAIHCWNVENQKTVIVDDPEVTRYTVDHLWPGTYQCAMSSIQADGSESSLSNAVTRVVH